MSKKLKILITNHNLAERAGTQLYVRDLALGLQKAGHLPFLYSPVVGEVTQELRDAMIPVVSDLKELAIEPDIIHGHHHLETLSALLHFPKTPALFVCHGWFPWQEYPPKFPRILRYVAIDQLTYQRMIFEHGIPEKDIRLIFNFTDLERFQPRASLPQHPRKALVYSNYISRNGCAFSVIQEACKRAGIEVDLVGSRADNVTANPERLLLNYDIVFAVGRSAIEAMATGASVIIYCGDIMGPMITSQNFHTLQQTNFGLLSSDRKTSYEAILDELSKYDPSDANMITAHLRHTFCKTTAVKAFLDLYQEVIEIPYTSEPLNEIQTLSRCLHHFSKDIQTEIKEIQLQQKKLRHLQNLYHRLLKIPLFGLALKSLKKRFFK